MKTTKFYSVFLSVLLLVPILFLQSCKDEEEEGPTNAFTFDEMTYTMTNGFVVTGGLVSTDGQAGTHNYHTIFLSDGDLDQYEIGEGGVTFALRLELYSPVSEPLDLAGGRYEYTSVNDINGQVDDLTETRFYTLSVFYRANGTDIEQREITGGIVNVFNSEEGDLSVTFDLDFSLGKNMTGGYDGTFVFIEEE